MQKIAIIGLSCLFPGAATPESFLQNLLEGRDSTSAHGQKQMGVDPALFYSPRKGERDKYYSVRGGYIQDFGLDPNDLELPADRLAALDDVYRWSLYVAREALRDSGYLRDNKAKSGCGLILGNLSFPTKSSNHHYLPLYQQVLEASVADLLGLERFSGGEVFSSAAGEALNARISGMPAAIVAEALSLSGIHFCLDAACASSLYAVKLACEYLLSGRADLMLAGAVSAGDPFFVHQGFSIFTAFSDRDESRPLDKNTDGLIAGEGAGMLVLKRYDEALRDGDRIWASICGIGLSNDGRGKFVLVPKAQGQILAYERAYVGSGIRPEAVSYIECHATGTPVGDEAELVSLDQFFGRYQAKPLIGAVKANFGHLLTAAGMPGMLKTILAMKEGIIPPTIHLQDPVSSPNQVIADTQVVAKPTPWPTSGPVRWAAVNAFGFGGTNAHVILQREALQAKTSRSGVKKNRPSGRILTFAPMAIIGMEAVFGPSRGLEAFDHGLYRSEPLFIPLPPKRWKGIESSEAALAKTGLAKGEIPRGAFIDAFELEVLRYKIPPAEIETMLPQQLLMLAVADQALRDAQIREGGNVAVIIAMEADPTLHQLRGRIDLSRQTVQLISQQRLGLSAADLTELERLLGDALLPPVTVNAFTSFIGNLMASRIASLWDFSGPAFTLSAEESSVPRALEIAQLLLNGGEVDTVLVGAVDMAGNVEEVLKRYQTLGRPDWKRPTLAIEKDFEGWSIGEGAGAVVLKLSEKAKSDRGRCYAHIDAVALGASTTRESVLEICRRSFKTAGIKADEVEYLELATIGERSRSEVEILVDAFAGSSSDYSCALGGASAIFGHCFAASGMLSLIKTALCLYRRYLPGIPNWQAPQEPLAVKGGPFYVLGASKSWFSGLGSKRRAAVCGSGRDGVFSQLLLSEDPVPKKRESSYLKGTPLRFFPVTANDLASLIEELRRLQRDATSLDGMILAEQNYRRLETGLEHKWAAVILGDCRERLLQEIAAAITGVEEAFNQGRDWQSPFGSYFAPKPLGPVGKVAFVYPGAFNSYLAMGRDRFQLFPELYDLAANYTSYPERLFRDRLVYPRSLAALSEKEWAEAQASLEEDAIANFETGINHAVLNTALMQGVFGIQPELAFGYSMGEVSMAFALGIWKNTDAMSDMLHSHPIFLERLAGPMKTAREAWGFPPAAAGSRERIWECYTVAASAAAITDFIATEPHVYLIIVNSPKEVIIAGEAGACRRVLAKMPFSATLTPMSDTLHCDLVRLEYDDILKLHTSPVSEVTGVSFYTAAGYQPIKIDSRTIATNVADIYCQTIDFPRLVERVYQDGARLFVELGPKGSCTKLIGDILGDRDHLAVTVDRKGADDYHSLLRALAKLYAHRLRLDLSLLFDRPELTRTDRKTLFRQIQPGGAAIDERIQAGRSRFRSQTENRGPLQTVPTSATHAPSAEANPEFEIRSPATETVRAAAKPFLSSTPPLARSSVSMTKAVPADSPVDRYQSQLSATHSAFLEARSSGLQQMKEMIRFQLMAESGQPLPLPDEVAGIRQPKRITQRRRAPGVIWDEKDLLAFAGGDIAVVFGHEYKVIDSYPYRVRLPLPPYLLVHRVVQLDAEKMVLKPAALVTEYDVPLNAWYSVDGQIPWAIASEAGQCDLLLISYLGIDFITKGQRYYRLTDYTMTFRSELPKAGDTLRYRIHIDSFMKAGEALFFNFGYECTVDGKLVYCMTGGRAGFSTLGELAQGKGIIRSRVEEETRRRIVKSQFTPLLLCTRTRFDRDDLLNITRGKIAACLGKNYDQAGANPSLRFAAEAMMMLDRIISIDCTGGPWGLGEVLAEKDLAPDHWYFPCHFKDDNVLAGTLITEGCVQLLEFYLLYLGLQLKTDDARFQPILDRPYVIRARGQIVPTDTCYQYRMEVMEIGLTPRPFARANFDIILNGKVIVDFRDLGIELVEKSPNDPARRFAGESPASQKPAPMFESRHIDEFAVGSLSRCFGPDYDIYKDRRAPRTPNGDLQLISRVLTVNGTRHVFNNRPDLISEYDVPVEAWFFRQNAYPDVPYAILMEIALQPCGFLAAFLGSTMVYPEAELCFRNLSADADLAQNVDLAGKTVTAYARLLSLSKAAETIVLDFDFALAVGGNRFYEGKTQFGYFTPKALSMQKGLDRGEKRPPWFEQEKIPLDLAVYVDLRIEANRRRYQALRPEKPHYRLAGPQLDFLDRAWIFGKGGRFGQGYVYAGKRVDPTDWFYPCHFFQDPVMPGSLGVEAILQATRLFALHFDLGRHMISPRFANVPGKTRWLYRGQITPDNQRMDIEVHIKKILTEETRLVVTADANLWKDGLRIYEVTDAAVAIVESE